MNGIWEVASENAPGSLIANVEGPVKFQTVLLALPENGKQSISDTSLIINNASSVTLILTTATSFKNYTDISGDPAAACEKILSNLSSKDYNVLLRNHENDFHRLMDRVHLTIGDQSMNEKPTDERVKLVKEGGQT
jgi:alpha-L-fucosidase 2